MNLDKEVWQSVTAILASTLPECEVTRTYDILERLSNLERDASTPKVYVCLDGKETEPLTQNEVKETYHFELFLVKYISARDSDGVMDEMDEMLPFVQRIQNRFYFRSETVSTSETPSTSLTLKLISSDPDSGELYDLDLFTDSESFMCAMSVSVVTTRNVSN